MNLVLYYIPDMDHFLGSIDKCSGHVFLELQDRRYLSLKGAGEGKSVLADMGRDVNGVRVLFENKSDAILLWRALLAS